VTYELAVTQAPHASFANGGEDADARQPFLRYTQRTWNGPRIAAAVASLAPGDFTTVWANSTGDIFRVRLPSSGSTFDILDWTPHGVWDATTEQVLIGGRRGLTKIIGYSDVTGDWRELPMPAVFGRFVAGTVHYYGKIARNPSTGVVYFGTSENDSRLFALTPGAETWEQLATAPTANNGNGGSFEWAADTDRLVQYVGAAERWLIYNPGDNTWSNPYNGLGHGQHAVLRYHGTPERHLLVGGTDTTRRASLVTSAGVVTQVTDVPADIRMSAGSWIHAHPSGCWVVKTMDEPTPGTYDPKIYACWPNGTLDDVTWVDLGAAPDAALTDTTLIPGYSGDTVLIVSTSGLHAWRVPNVGTSITAGVGSATASGPSATISAGASTAIAGEVGAAAASGLAASVRLTTAIAAAVGTATASGLAAGVSAATRIAGAVATATASGLQASLTRPTPIAAAVGAADATGQPAAVRLTTAFTAGVGAAEASGLPADVSISGATVISAGVATAAASGLRATIVTAATIAAGVAAAEASGLGAQIVLTTRIGAGVGAAAASGLAAGITVSTTTTIAGAVGVATANGRWASITVGTPAPPSTYLRYEVPGSSLRYEVGGTSLRIEL
jgi:hypothetical protein